jgi:hemoglobin-like flavoprotein
MSITVKQRVLIQRSFGKVAQKADRFGEVFYNRLFEVHPSTTGLFSGSIEEQRRKLVRFMAMIVASLDDEDALDDMLAGLVERHRGYGVGAAHFALFGGVLTWTLEQVLGASFTADVRDAWLALCAEIVVAASTPVR